MRCSFLRFMHGFKQEVSEWLTPCLWLKFFKGTRKFIFRFKLTSSLQILKAATEEVSWKNMLKHIGTYFFFSICFFLEKASLNWWWKYVKNISEGISLFKTFKKVLQVSLVSTSLQLCWKWIASQGFFPNVLRVLKDCFS